MHRHAQLQHLRAVRRDQGFPWRATQRISVALQQPAGRGQAARRKASSRAIGPPLVHVARRLHQRHRLAWLERFEPCGMLASDQERRPLMTETKFGSASGSSSCCALSQGRRRALRGRRSERSSDRHDQSISTLSSSSSSGSKRLLRRSNVCRTMSRLPPSRFALRFSTRFQASSSAHTSLYSRVLAPKARAVALA